ncbi:DUF4767 domain-containing protein [Lactococcus sp. NH2-7C]|uniref:DUF4767 domain-containing protein n=1 Tax=Lactococcus sp. NH2-7C TaxID=2879149 RepID=UPI001CDBEFB0|nr:DUF4767 domain-containing protein [Lactococcus sp. NH2-7C]MCA2390032.1 DUF4767 domain-containing protein [Lactococcus sp. NH2-7C]WGV30275.1 DUF4767 domain-containing protein [Lactococcus sp. NH2-7C]
MKKVYIVAIFLVTTIGMSACNSKQSNQIVKESSKNSQSSKSSLPIQSASSTPQSSSIIKESSLSIGKSISPSTSMQIRKWNPEKNQRLSEFMSAWGIEMGQSYSQYNPNHNLNLYGLSIPWSVIDNNSTWKAAIDNQPIELKWSETGEDTGGYQLVDVYSDVNEKNSGVNHVYLFVIKAGNPIVLYTAQNQGNANNYLYLKETKNNELKTAFARIVE